MERATRILNGLSALVLLVSFVYVQVTLGSFVSDSVRVQTGLAGLGWIGLNCWVWFRKEPAEDEIEGADNP